MASIPLHVGKIYGPVRSRRLGWSLGLNISPTTYKLCSFNCIYCQYGWTSVCTTDITHRLADLPSPDDFGMALEVALRENEKIDNITFSGNGEPTLHHKFEELVDIAKRLRDRFFPKARVGILSNSSAAGNETVLRGLVKLDFRIMKLDAGDTNTFRRINLLCKQVSYVAILNSLRFMENITLQTMFIEGKTQNTGEREIKEWVERVGELKPASVQIYTLHRPAADSSLRSVPEEKLRRIANYAEETTGVPVGVYL